MATSTGNDVTNVFDNISSICGNVSEYICNETLSNLTSGNETYTEIPGYSGPPLPLWLTILLGALAAVVVVTTVAGNITVLLAFVLERNIRQPTNYFIASLAVSDLLIGIFSMPCFTLYLLLGYWPLGDIVCDLWLSLDWTICLASQYTVFFITVDRFFSVKIPAKYRNWRSETKVIIMIAFTWIIPCAVFFTSIIGWQYFVGERTVDSRECAVQFMSDPLFTFLLTIGYYWTTLFVMFGLYGGIYNVALSLQKKANKKHKKMKTAMESADRNRQGKSDPPGAAAKESRKRTENNNARHLRGVDTTSFSKPDEDRSSSPAFASDEENSSSQGACINSKTPLTSKLDFDDDDDDDQTCFVNSAVQTDTTYRPSLKGMLGVSFNHVAKMAFSITASSGVTLPNRQGEAEDDCPVLSRPLSEEGPPAYSNICQSKEDESSEKPTKQRDALVDSDILEGCRYIDEDSLKSLTSAENIKLLSELNNYDSSADDGCSPIWKRRSDKYMPIPIPEETNGETSVELLDGDDSDHVTNSDVTNKLSSNGKSTALSVISALKNQNNSLGDNNSERRVFGSPFHALVKSMREKQKKQKENKDKKTKSKSENRARKALRTITFILGAYVLCWTPYHIMVFIIALCRGYGCINMSLYNFTYWLCYLNSPVNPFCYALANQQFKRTLLRIIRLDCHRT